MLAEYDKPILCTVKVGEYDVHFRYVKPEMIKHTKFCGEKMFHPWKIIETNLEGKRFNHYDCDQPNSPEVSLSKQTTFQLKHDGGCMMVDISTDSDGNKTIDCYTRIDLKLNTKTNQWKKFPEEALASGMEPVPCCSEPAREDSYHWPHMYKIIPKTGKAAKRDWKWKAFQHSLPMLKQLDDGQYTGEWMGKKFNNKTTDCVTNNCIIIHGTVEIDIPVELRNYRGFNELFNTVPIEGIVAYTDFDDMHIIRKIKTDMFEGLNWPPKSGKVFNITQMALDIHH